MPEVKSGESEQEWLKRCIPFQLNENPDMEKDQAAAICYAMYGKSKKDEEVTMSIIDRIDSFLINEASLGAVKSQIEQRKRMLKNTKVKENFGQKEVSKLEDMYSEHQHKNDGIWDAIRAFDEWCMNYTGKNESTLIEESEVDVENFISKSMKSPKSKDAMWKLVKVKLRSDADEDEFDEIWDSFIEDEYLVKTGSDKYKWSE